MASFQEQVPQASSQEKGPITGIMGGPLMWGAGIIQGEYPGDFGEIGSFLLQEKEQRMELEILFLVEMQLLFVSQAMGLLLHPPDGRLSHSLCVSCHCSVSVLQIDGGHG